MEIMPRLPTIPHFWSTSLLVSNPLGVARRYDALAIDGDTGSSIVLFISESALRVKCLVTSRVGVSAQMHGMGILVSDSR